MSVQLMPPPRTADQDKGHQLLDAVSRIRNIRLATMGHRIAQLLHSDLWRGYTLPTGEWYTWKGCEFDLFLTAMGFDPSLVVHAARATGDRQLLLDLAHASDHQHPDRRPVDTIVAMHRSLTGRLTPTRLGGAALHQVIGKPSAEHTYVQGAGADAARNPRGQFKVTYSKTGDSAADRHAVIDAIVRRLHTDGLASDVRQALN